MPKANEVAAELRKLADSLDKEPEAEIEKPMLSFYHWDESDKERFLAIAGALPRPLKKSYSNEYFKLDYETPAIHVYAKVPRSAVCRVVTPAIPAQYECEPLLSDEEVEAIGAE